jgi:hypothetical protein
MKDKYKHIRFDTHIKISFCGNELKLIGRSFSYENSEIYPRYFYLVYYHLPTNCIIVTDNSGWNGFHQVPETYLDRIDTTSDYKYILKFFASFNNEINWDYIFNYPECPIDFDWGKNVIKALNIYRRYLDIKKVS